MRVVGQIGVYLACLALLSCGPQERPAPQNAQAPKLDFHAVQFYAGGSPVQSKAQVGGTALVVMNPDDPVHPTAWDGPLVITDSKTQGKCSADISLINAVFASSDSDYLVVTSYSGSERFIHYIDARRCTDKWPVKKVFSGGIEASGELLTVQPECECGGKSDPCDCSAGMVLQLRANQAPSELHEQSQALTKRVIGVAFEGRAKVLRPKTASASLVAR